MKSVEVSLPLLIIRTDFFTANLFNIETKNNNYLLTLVTGFGDLTYNTKRNLLGAISVSGKIAYHLFSVDANCSTLQESVKLIRKSKWNSWHSQYDYDYEGKFDLLLT